jgi:hypothetical protein
MLLINTTKRRILKSDNFDFFLFDSSNIFLHVADPLFMPSVGNQLNSCWTAYPAAAADGSNLSSCEAHEDTRLLSWTEDPLSTCEEHEHTLSKTANNCSVKIKWKCYKFAGRCNDLNSWPLAVGAADSVPYPRGLIFFSLIQLGSQSVSGHSKLHRERESYIKVRSLESAHLNASVSNRTREHICVYQIRFWQPGIQQKHLFLCMMFFVREGRTKTSSFSLGLLLLQPSELKEAETILQGNSHICTTERNTLTHIREWPFTFIYILMAERLWGEEKSAV